MRTLNIALFALTILALASAADNTCVGNPYFTAPYNPNPVDMPVPSAAELKTLNITYNDTTKIYNFTNYTDLNFCKGLIKTGSCCSPDLLNKTAKSFENLMFKANNATLKIFRKRANTLRDYGKIYGKIISSLVNLASKVHGDAFKLVNNAHKLLNDKTILSKILIVVQDANYTDALMEFVVNQTTKSLEKMNRPQAVKLAYQILTAISGDIGINKGDIAVIFGSVKSLVMNFQGIPDRVFDYFEPFPLVDKAYLSDAGDSLNKIFRELIDRSSNITLDLSYSMPVEPTPKKSLRILSAIIADNKTIGTEPVPTPVSNNTGVITFPFPLMADARNIEAIAKAILDGIGNAKTSNELFSNFLKNNETIYKAINATFVSGIKNFSDINAGGDWVNLRTLLVTIAKLSFDEATNKLVTVAENKKKCMNTVFQYQGYLGCLACDASALALGKIIIRENNGTKTFSPVISGTFGGYLQGNCTDYFKDLIFMKGFMQGIKAFRSVNDNDNKSKKNAKDVDVDMDNIDDVNKTTIDYAFSPQCSLKDLKCDWIKRTVVDSLGPTTAFLCDYSQDDCEDLGFIKNLRAPFIKKDTKKRMLDDTDPSAGDVSYSEDSQDDESKTDVGFQTNQNYTVPANETANITVDTTQENNTDDSSNVSNTSNTTNTTKKFGFKSLVSIPLIVATILAFLL